MDVFVNLSGSLPYKDCNLNSDGSYLQGQFVREISAVAECKNNDPSSNLKHILVNPVDKSTDSHLDEILISQNKRDDNGMLYPETQGSPVEDLRQAFETELSLYGEEKQDCNANQTKMGHEFPCKDEKKNKHNGPFQSSNPNLALDEDAQQKIEQNKTSICTQEPSMGKTLFKCATFPYSGPLSPSSMDVMHGMIGKAENITMHGCQSHESRKIVYTRTSSLPCSFKLISAMRGGHEQNGLGPRPKLCVKWAPDVQEPKLSSASHTVKSHSRCQSKKKDHKHKHKSKSSHANGSNKKHHSKRRNNSEGVHSRLQSSSVHGNRILLDVSTLSGSMLIPEKSCLMALEAPICNTQMERGGTPQNIASKPSEQCCCNGKNGFVPTVSSDADFPLQDSKCGSSFRHTFQGKHLPYAEDVKSI